MGSGVEWKITENYCLKVWQVVVTKLPSFLPRIPDIQRAIRKNIPIITMIQAHEGWVMLSEINRFLNYTNDIKSIFKSVVSFFYTYLRWELYNFRVSDVIIAPAHEVADSLKKWFFINQDKVAVIYNCVDLIRFKPDETARQRI